MKSHLSFKFLVALLASVTLAVFAFAHEKPAAEFIKVGDAHVSAEWLAKARADYPLQTCVISKDKLDGGDMGAPQDYIYRQAGQPDRLVRLCCNDCVKDFKENPAAQLKLIDEAAAKVRLNSDK